jgi:N-acetyl-anhydromuramyl-L-alanine amidase AmpD
VVIDRTRRTPNVEPRIEPVRCIVLHATAGSEAGSVAWLCNPTSRVGAHYVISKTGIVRELADPGMFAAWHAGVSTWGGRTNVNRFSIGIELVNRNDGRDPYPDDQIIATATLCVGLMRRFGLSVDALDEQNLLFSPITTHAAIALPKGRKTDPRSFPLGRFFVMVRRMATSPDDSAPAT